MFTSIGAPEILVIFLLILILFGADKLPEIAKGIGKGMNEFKKASDNLKDEIQNGQQEINDAFEDGKQDINDIYKNGKQNIDDTYRSTFEDPWSYDSEEDDFNEDEDDYNDDTGEQENTDQPPVNEKENGKDNQQNSN